MKDNHPILTALLAIKQDALAGKVKDPMCGLCVNVSEYANIDENSSWVRTKEWLGRQFYTWPKFSGDTTHPIVGGHDAYIKAKYEHSMFSRTTRYGRLRWNLLNHLIRKAKEQNV